MKAFFKDLILSARFLAAVCAFMVPGLGSMMAQTTLTGKVTDDNGSPLPGVTIMVVGTTHGALTDNEGEYSIAVENGDELEFSCLGMATVRKVYEGQETIDVTMSEDNLYLTETVLIGYGAMRRESLTGSVSQVQGDEILKGPATNVTSVLAGKMTGISSVQESGQPGQDQAALRIRGSMYDVKYIVDGIPRSIDGIDPNEIESISILKDAAAAAVYGLGGAGGVIIVTTKSGNVGDTRISYTGSGGVSMNANYPEFLDGPGYAYYYNRALELDGLAPRFSQEDVQSMIDGTNGFGNTNWIDATFGTGINTQHNVSVSGGTEKIRYFASLGYLHQKGNVNNFNYTRYNARMNLDANIAKNLVFKFGIAGQVGDQRSPGLAAGGSWNADMAESELSYYSIGEQAIYAHPYLPMYYEGDYVGSLDQTHSRYYNPIAATNESGKYKTVTTSIQTTATLQWNLPWVKGLNVKFTGSYDKTFEVAKNLSTPFYMRGEIISSTLGTGTKEYSGLQVDPRSNTEIKLLEGLGQSQQMVGQASINFDRTFGKHDVKALGLVEFTDWKYNNFGARGKGLDFVELPELGQVNEADTDSGLPVYGSSSQSRSVGFVARLNYAYDSRYLIELSGRYDGSYKFAGNVKGKRWGFFPSASVAWRISNEPFFEPAKMVLNDLKIRASFGEVGSDNINPFNFLSRLSQSGYSAIFGGTPVYGWTTSTVANPLLTWERQRSVNAGFDASFWQRKLGIEFDAFYTYTYDILAGTTGYPDSMGGYYPTYSNNNAIDNRGVEITLSHDNRVGDFEYGARLTLSWARAKYVKYADAYGTPSYQRVTGSIVNTDLLLVAEGLFQTEEEIDASPWYNGKRPQLGDIKYKDIDGDGVIDAWKDRTYSGRNNRPELTGGLNLYAAWKGIDVSLMFTGAALFDVALTGEYGRNVGMDSTPFTDPFKADANAPVYLVEGSWTPENPNAEYPRLSVNRSTGGDNSLASTFWYRDGKYIRLKTAQIGYTFPQKWMKAIGVQQLRVFVEGGNLFTLSGLPEGIDPESPGVNIGYYPQQRTVMGGLSITF